MRISYLGDSYDIVKQSLLHWLRHFGKWSVHPMFTEPVSQSDAAAFQALLGAQIVSREVLTRNSNRVRYLSCASTCGNLFLDPDTGLRMRPTHGEKAPQYLFADELIGLTEQRQHSLTVVFDQSLGRGSERSQLEVKLQELHRCGLFAFAYVSHACFVVASRDGSLVRAARARVISESRLPKSRLLAVLPS